MGGIDVASVVASILAAFGSGMDVFCRLGGKKRKSRARLARPSEEEEWLRQSLEHRPLEIRKEYDQNRARFGRQFEVGDSAAHSSLAHTLLVLNTGLINLINHALSGDSKTKSMSRKALFTLSETAAMDTMTALGQLSSRLSLASQSRLALETTELRRSHRKHGHHKERKNSSLSPWKQARPPPSPLLVRGGWVRSRSGSSVVSGATARRAREEQAEKHHGSKSDSAALKSASQSKPSATRRATERSEASARTCKCADEQLEEPREFDKNKSETHSKPQRQPSMLIVPSDFFDSPQSQVHDPPPRPPKIPLHARPNPRPHRMRPASTATFMTTSTKIGEIHESRWPDTVLSPEMADLRRMPYTIPPPLESTEPKKKKGLKFWKREDKRGEVSA